MLVFETGLPTRYYLDRSSLTCAATTSSRRPTETACPYKGRTTAYWSARIGDGLHEDLAWCYDFPTRALLPIAGLVAFYDEKVDVCPRRRAAGAAGHRVQPDRHALAPRRSELTTPG